MVKIKICGITSIEDMLAAVNAGADAIGLVFVEKSPRCVSIDQARAIIKACPPFLTKVGLFVDASQEEVRQHCEALSLDILQFHGDESVSFCESFNQPYLKALTVREGEDLNSKLAQYSSASGLLLDTYHPEMAGGTGKQFDWNLIPNDIQQALVLAGGLTPGNVSEAVEKVKPYAVDVSSGVEMAPGKKDHAKIQAFCDAVRG